MKLGRRIFHSGGRPRSPPRPDARPRWRGPGRCAPRCRKDLIYFGTALAQMACSTACRSRLRSQSRRASSSARAGSLVSSRSAATSAAPMRPGGVDPGREHKADLDGGDGLAQQSRLLQKGMDAHKVRMGQGGQPAGDDGAVLPLHPHDVGDGADGGQGAVPGKQGVFPVFGRPGPAPASAPRPRPPDA